MTSARRPVLRWRLLLLGGALIGFALAIWIRSFFLLSVYVTQESMLPTLQPGDWILVYLRAYRHRPPQVGDIVVFPHPEEVEEEDNLVVKRVVGVPGDVLRITPRGLWRNGVPLAEWYLQNPQLAPPYLTVVVPQGFVYVLGDNRNWSEDSRDYGAVPILSLTGRAILLYWPFQRFRILRRGPIPPRLLPPSLPREE